MLPLGFSLGVLLNLIIHWAGFHKHFPSFSRPVFKTLFQISGASVIMGYVSYLGLNFFDNLFNLDTLLGIFFQGFLSGILGILSAIIVLHILGSQELKEVWSTLHKRIWKTEIVSPDAEL